jgi:hypothetical protein
MCAGVMPLLGLDTFNAVGSGLPDLFEFRVGDYRVMLVMKGRRRKKEPHTVASGIGTRAGLCLGY